MTVMPRFRAIKPVRIEFGDHFADVSEEVLGAAVALFTTVECSDLHLRTCGRWPRAHNLSILSVEVMSRMSA